MSKERGKTELETKIAGIVGRAQSDKAEAAGITAVVSSFFRELVTGQWSDKKEYQTDDFLRKEETKHNAYNTLAGFLWGLYAAGAIDDIERITLQDELLEINAPKESED